MRILYTPADGEKREWPFEPQKMLSIEAEAIETVTGWTFNEFGEKFVAGSTKAQHAVLWVLLRRENRGLKYGQVQFRMDELDVAFDPDELDAMREALENPEVELPADQREAMETYLAAQLVDGAPEEAGDDEDPPGESSPADTGT